MMGGQHTRLQSVGVAREFVAGSEAFALVRGGGGGVLFQVEFELRTGGCGGGDVEVEQDLDVEVEQDLDVEVDLVEKRCRGRWRWNS